ncbi:MAG: hypothetical protein H6833_00225 [Planctomycetes bacterium]|nr:hypothetical protein [Planctomycetota bacterium]
MSSTPSTGTADSGVFDTLADPKTLQLLLVIAIVIALLVALWSLRRGLRRIEGRKRIVPYLDGVAALWSGDPEVAVKLLSDVVEADPANVGARIAYGEALERLGRHAEAHEQHVEANESFGVEGPGIELAIVRDLHAAGAEADALERVQSALARHPRDARLLRLAFEIQSEAGQYDAALDTGRRLLQRDGGQGLEKALAAVAVQGGLHALGRHDQDRATKFFRDALAFDRDNVDATRALSLMHGDARAALLPGRLDGESPESLRALPSHAGDRNELAVAIDQPGIAVPAMQRRTLAAILAFFPDAVCAKCGASRDSDVAICPSCGRSSRRVHADDGIDEELLDVRLALDEIEQNERWFQRLAERLVAGDNSVHTTLARGGTRALTALLRLAQQTQANPDLESTLVAIGRDRPQALLDVRAAATGESKRMLEGSRTFLERASGIQSRRSVDDVLAPVFRALGPPAREAITDVLGQASAIADRGLRGLIVDYFVGLADLEAFDDLGRRFAPVEIVRRLNMTPDDSLVSLFEQLPAGRSFLRDAILADPALDRPRALVRASLSAGNRDSRNIVRWKELFAARGPGQRVLGFLVDALRSLETCATSEALLEHFRHEALERLVAAFADPEADVSRLESHVRLLRAAGTESADALVRCFSSAPSEADERVIALLAELGKSATAKLEAAYRGKVGWLGALGAKRFLAKHPRACIARAIALTKGRGAEKALERLAAWESEPDLVSTIREFLRRREGEDHA